MEVSGATSVAVTCSRAGGKHREGKTPRVSPPWDADGAPCHEHTSATALWPPHRTTLCAHLADRQATTPEHWCTHGWHALTTQTHAFLHAVWPQQACLSVDSLLCNTPWPVPLTHLLTVHCLGTLGLPLLLLLLLAPALEPWPAQHTP
jgi:hypothetical protein